MSDGLKLHLPLVSVIIINYNYGRFLNAAVESVKNQTYPHIECIIVDDSSTDESPMQLERITAAFPDIKCIRNEVNSGQTFSCFTGFNASHGDFVLFLDSDDILFDNAITTHILVHLSSRIHAGFTTCDMIQTVDNRVMIGAFFPSGLLANLQSQEKRSLLHRLDETCPELWPANAIVAKDLELRVFYLPPTDAARKYFAPTSGNCFRRDALLLFLDNHSPMELRLNTDVYIREAVFLITGAIAIDIPLFSYCIHGANGFSKHADLANRISIDPAKDLMTRKIANRAIADRLGGNADFFLKNFGYKNLEQALHALLVDVRQATASDLDEFTDYLHSQLKARKEHIITLTSQADFERLLFRYETSTKPGNPFQRIIAEFFLTIGRLVNSSTLNQLGERIWRA